MLRVTQDDRTGSGKTTRTIGRRPAKLAHIAPFLGAGMAVMVPKARAKAMMASRRRPGAAV